MRPKKIILAIDDNELVLSVHKYMLETRGYRVLTASQPSAALEIFDRGGIDLVICDLVMPDVDGNELVGQMKDRRPEVPVLLISAVVQSFDKPTAADAFLPKGCCSAFYILERVRLMVARKRGPRKGWHLAANPAAAKAVA